MIKATYLLDLFGKVLIGLLQCYLKPVTTYGKQTNLCSSKHRDTNKTKHGIMCAPNKPLNYLKDYKSEV